MPSNQKVWALILAGGSGRRFGQPKQFAQLGDERLVDRTVRVASSVSDGVTVVIPEGFEWDGPAVDHVVVGGSSHMGSTRCGLAAVPADVSTIIIGLPSHPLASAALYQKLLERLRQQDASACAPASALPDALKEVADGSVIRTQSRTGLLAVPFPAVFNAAALRKALNPADNEGPSIDYAEELEAIEVAGGRVVVVENEPTNIHITTPEELEIARRLLPLVPDA